MNLSSEKFLHFPYSSSIKPLINNTTVNNKGLTTTTPTEKIFQIDNGFEMSPEAEELLLNLGVWKKDHKEIAYRFKNDVKEMSRWFPPNADVPLCVWRIRNGIEPEKKTTRKAEQKYGG